MLDLNKLTNDDKLVGISGIPLIKIDFNHFYQNNYDYLARKLRQDRYLGSKMLFYLNSRGNLVVRNDNFDFASSSCVGVYKATRDNAKNMLRSYLNTLRIAMNKELNMSKAELLAHANNFHNDLFLFKPQDFANWLFDNLKELAPAINNYAHNSYFSYLVDCDYRLAFKFVKKVFRSKNMQPLINNYKLENMLLNTVQEVAVQDPANVAQYLNFIFEIRKSDQDEYYLHAKQHLDIVKHFPH